MKAIWLACCACGDYGLLQREVEGRDAGAQVLRVGDLDGLISMARAFPSRRGAAIIAASLFDTEDVRKTVARLTAEGRVSRVVVLIEALDPSDIEGLFRAGATEVIAAHSICGNGRAGEGAVDSDRHMTIEPDAFVDREPGAPRATRGPRVDDYGKAEAEHGRRPRNPLVYDDAGGPAQHAGDSPAVDMGYVHGVNLADELDEVEGFAGCGELSLMQHEQIAQNEPASQTEQAAMPAWTQRVVAAGETGTLPPTPAPPPPMPPADAAAPQHRAPVICAISGSGGCGKSTIVATMAHTSSLLGLRAAVLDLDLMFGNLYDLLGVDAPRDMAAPFEASAGGVSRTRLPSRISWPHRCAWRRALRSGAPSRRPSKPSSWHVRWSYCLMFCVANPTWSLSIPRSFGATPWRLRWRRATVAWSLAMRRYRPRHRHRASLNWQVE